MPNPVTRHPENTENHCATGQPVCTLDGMISRLLTGCQLNALHELFGDDWFPIQVKRMNKVGRGFQFS